MPANITITSPRISDLPMLPKSKKPFSTHGQNRMSPGTTNFPLSMRCISSTLKNPKR